MRAKKKVCNRDNCNHKGKRQKITNFYKDVRMKDGRASTCKDCIKANHHRNVEYNNAMTDEQIKQWNIDNPVVRSTARTVDERINR